MKLAIITITNNGTVLAEKLAQGLEFDATVYVKKGRNCHEVGIEYESLSLLVENIFWQYDGLIFIMATGIVVRMIAPLIRDKRFDPAVVVVDEAGKYAISLLSGHIGGANELAQRVSGAIGSVAVITTATDVGHKPAADVLAVKLGLSIEPFPMLKTINAAIANGEEVVFLLDSSMTFAADYAKHAAAMGIDLQDINIQTADYDAAVIVSDRDFPINKPHLYLRSAKLAVGIGCRRNTSQAEIIAAVTAACQKIGRSVDNISVIGSTTVKQDEPGLLATAKYFNVSVRFFDNKQLKSCIEKYNLDISSFVNDKIGVGNVCEAAALLAGQNNKLLLPKTKFNRVTVAIAPANYL